MSINVNHRTKVCFAIILITSSISGMTENLLIDDFTVPGQSKIGSSWQGFTDSVMGGVSTINAGYYSDSERSFIRMVGDVSLANNGGFAQIRLPLDSRNGWGLDASLYSGILLEVKGVSGSYSIHLRTRDTRLPWQYYAAKLKVTNEWETVKLPFAEFKPKSLSRDLRISGIRTFGLVAGEKEFRADISIARLALYQ